MNDPGVPVVVFDLICRPDLLHRLIPGHVVMDARRGRDVDAGAAIGVSLEAQHTTPTAGGRPA